MIKFEFWINLLSGATNRLLSFIAHTQDLNKRFYEMTFVDAKLNV